MQTYELRLESPVDSQARTMSIQAENEAEARSVAEAKEAALANFSLLPPDRETWEQPPGGDHDPTFGLVDLNRWDARDPQFKRAAALASYDEARRMARHRLGEWSSRVDIANDGKVKHSNLRGRDLGRLLAHRQVEPYAIVDVRRIAAEEIERQRTVAALARATADPEAWAKAIQALKDGGIPTAAVTAALYGLPWQKQIDGSSVTVFSSATVKVSLHTARTANVDTDDFWNDASGTEVTGTGYTTGGATLASKASTYDTASDQIRLDAADVSWTTSTISATDAEVWVDTAGASSADPLWGNVDFGATVATTAGTFQITWDSTGIIVIDVT